MTEANAAEETRTGRVPPWLVLLVLAVGVALRVRVHLGGRALWIDEAMLALNLVPRSLAGLLEPLDWDQGAPLAWLVTCKLVTSVLGTAESALRAPAFLASLVTLPLVLRVGRRHLGEVGGLVATALYAVMPSVVYQSSEFKPYTFDALFALVIVALHLELLTPCARPRLVRLALVGAVSVWFSIPAAFVLAGCGGTFLLSDLFARRMRDFGARLLVAVVWMVSFGVHFAFLQTLLANTNLETYWQDTAAFLPLPPRSGEDLRVILELVYGFFRDPLRSPYIDVLSVGSRTGMVLVCAVAVGARVLARRDRRVAGVLLLPLLVSAVASGLEVYPLQGRLLLFAAPLVALLVGAGVGALLESRERTGHTAGVALLVGVLLWPVVGAVDVLREGPRREEVDDLLDELAERAQPGDTLFVYYGARPAYEYYAQATDRFDASALHVVFGPPRAARVSDYEPSLTALDGGGRTWVLLSHVHTGMDGDEGRHHLVVLDRLGAHLEHLDAPGASLELYDL